MHAEMDIILCCMLMPKALMIALLVSGMLLQNQPNKVQVKTPVNNMAKPYLSNYCTVQQILHIIVTRLLCCMRGPQSWII